MVGYVFIAILIFFVGIYFMAYNLFGGYPSFGYVLLSCTIIFMVAVPILTMRSMAEDRRGKTDQLLLTSPVSLTGIVLGKYLAMVTVLLVPILLICFCPLIIAMNGSATLTADYAAILAFFCMGCVYIAVGMFVSALTESQIIAAVGTFAALLVLYLWTDLVSFLPDSLAQLLSSFDFQGVLDNFAYYSVFDLGGLLLYLSMAAVFVFLTVQVLQRRKGSPPPLPLRWCWPSPWWSTWWWGSCPLTWWSGTSRTTVSTPSATLLWTTSPPWSGTWSWSSWPARTPRTSASPNFCTTMPPCPAISPSPSWTLWSTPPP